MAAPDAPRPGRLFTFRAGGWVVVLAVLVSMALIAWAVAPAVLRLFNRPPGDGQNPATYGFDLANCAVPADELVAATLYRDMVPVMDDPAVVTTADIDAINEHERGKVLVSADRVVGVVLNGAARAYPLRILNVHEIINDTLGGVPIAVTYHWPCDSVVVFDRRLDGEVLEFGHSGLVHNANLLLYDRQAGADPVAPQPNATLWRQLDGQALAGPGAGRALRIIPAHLVNWQAWQAREPATTVAQGYPALQKRYKKANPASYFRQERPAFPATPAPPADGLRAMAPVLAVTAGGDRRVYPLEVVQRLAGAESQWTDTLGGARLRFTVEAAVISSDKNQPATMAVEVIDGPPPDDFLAIPCLWFAWHALHPGDVPLAADNPAAD